jgi:putative DNA primase/helicase
MFAALLIAGSELSKESAPAEIEKLLQSAAEAALSLIEREKLIALIHSRTKIKKQILTQQMTSCLSKGEPVLQDDAYGLARLVLKKYFAGGKHLRFAPDGRFYWFMGSHWVPIPDPYLGNRLLDEATKSFPAAKSLSSLVSNAINLLEHLVVADESLWLNNEPLPVVNCANGEVWIDKSGKPELRPHNPDSYLTACLPISFDPAATCPAYDKALTQIFGNASAPDEMVRHWHEFAGYALQPRRDFAYFWLLIGHGANGKSKLLQTIQRLLGPDAVYNGPIAQFHRDRFSRAALAGKLLFVDDDMAGDTHLDDGLLKSISEAKELTTRHAFGRQSFKFRCLALPVMAGNHYPSTSDTSHGLRRRAMVIPFDRQFGPDEADKDLFPKIWETELPGILNRALEGLAHMRQRGKFRLPIDCEKAAQEFLAHANPLHGFIDDRCETDSSGHILLSVFRNLMKAWAAAQGIKKPIPYNTLKRQLEGLGFEVKMVNGYHRVNGLGLKKLPQAAE